MILQLRLLNAIEDLLWLLLTAEYIEVKPLLVDLKGRRRALASEQRCLRGESRQRLWRRIEMIYRLLIVVYFKRWE